MRQLLFLLFFTPALTAHESPALEIEGTLYSEIETTQGHTLQTERPGGDLSFADESERLTTLYTIVNYTHTSDDEKWVLNLEGRAALKLTADPYTIPVYRTLYGNEAVNRALITQASIDYYDDDFAWSAGRNRLDLDWLSGSFDSVLFYSMKPWVETRLFWFIDYYDFQYNYYTKYTGINDDKGIAGIYLQSGEALQNWEWACFYYHVFDQAYLGGLKLSKPLDFMNIQAKYSYLKPISGGKLPDESFLQLRAETEISEHHSITLGFSQTGEHGLTAMLRFGAHAFSPFYLTGAVDRPDAKNLYLHYKYENDRFFLETVGGITSYRDKALEQTKLTTKEMNAREIDIQASYALNTDTTLTLGYMLLDLGEKDNLAFDQNLLTLSMSVQWP